MHLVRFRYSTTHIARSLAVFWSTTLNGYSITVQSGRDIPTWRCKHSCFCWRSRHHLVVNCWFYALPAAGRGSSFIFCSNTHAHEYSIKYSITMQNIFLLISLPLFRRQVLEDLEIVSAFNTILHVPNLSTPDHLLNVLEEVDLFSKHELASLHARLQGKRYYFW